jgi:hypothetical protein
MEDKIEPILNDLNLIQDQMEDNVHHMMDHMVQLEDLESKSENIKYMSQGLQSKTKQLNDIGWWKIHWIVLCLFLFATCLILLVVLLIVRNA